MIVVIRPDATAEGVLEVRQRIRSRGLDVELSKGEEGDLVVVLGDTRAEAELERELRSHAAVAMVVPLLPQRRYERLFSRRSLGDLLAASILGILGLLAAGATALFLSPSGARRRQRDVVRAGSVTDFERRPWQRVDVKGRPVLVVRTANGEFHALSAICTHLEICQVEWNRAGQELVCPCHRAAFDVHGNVLHGPPPRPLPTHAVAVIGDGVYVRLRA